MTNKNDFNQQTNDDFENELLANEEELLLDIDHSIDPLSTSGNNLQDHHISSGNSDDNLSSDQASNQEVREFTQIEGHDSVEKKDDDNVTIQKSKLVLIKKLTENIKENSEKLLQLLSVYSLDKEIAHINIGQLTEEKLEQQESVSKIIEGVFDGEKMIGPDGKHYSVPANYASKSKLVEGDILKLTITKDGTFVYKQIGPIERKRVVGILDKDSDGSYYVKLDNKKWRVLTASVTYFKGTPGDEAIILIPKTGESKWAAVENIISKIS